MKLYIKQIMLITAFVSFGLLSCEDDEVEGTPMITNIRVIASDSTITAGEFELPIAIQGTNLGFVQQVFFNDQETDVNPVYVTNDNILVFVPNEAPNELNNKITLVTASGTTVTADFEVILPAPVIIQAYNEFAKPGTETDILGNYFYFIEKVMIGDKEAEILEYTPTSIRIKLPDEIGVEPVTVIGEGGTTISAFNMNETAGNMINFDIPATDWGSDVCWGDAERINPEDSDIEPVSGRYTRIKQTNLAPTGYQGDWVVSTCWFDFKLPAGAHSEKVFKFEANIIEPWKGGSYTIMVTLENGNIYNYSWKPWDNNTYRSSGITTDGWRTFYIPLSEFHRYDGDDKVDPVERIPNVASIRDLRIDFNNGAKDAPPIPLHHVALDNFRIVDID